MRGSRAEATTQVSRPAASKGSGRRPTSRLDSAERLDTELVLAVLRTQTLIGKEVARRLRPHDLSPAAFNVLMALRQAPGPLCPREIADRLLVTRGAVSGVLDSLERRGFVSRRPHAEDRRMLIVELTAQGCACVDGLLPEHRRSERDLLSGLTPAEKRTLAGLLDRLETRLARPGADAAEPGISLTSK